MHVMMEMMKLTHARGKTLLFEEKNREHRINEICAEKLEFIVGNDQTSDYY